MSTWSESLRKGYAHPAAIADSTAGALDSTLSLITRNASQNSALSAQMAAEQRDWQERQNRLAMDFNMAEAAKNRNWQQMMSNTAHQREIADLKAAGLNPVLSASGGNGAAVTSGATASGVTSAGAKGEVDTSVNSAIVGILGSILNAQTQLEAANVSARTQEAVADKYTAMEKIVADISRSATLGSANIHAAASRYGAELGYAGSKYASDTNRYATDQNIANPNNIYGLVREMVKGATGADSAKSASSGITSAIKSWLYKAANPSSKDVSTPGSKHKSGRNHQR